MSEFTLKVFHLDVTMYNDSVVQDNSGVTSLVVWLGDIDAVSLFDPLLPPLVVPGAINTYRQFVSRIRNAVARNEHTTPFPNLVEKLARRPPESLSKFLFRHEWIVLGIG